MCNTADRRPIGAIRHLPMTTCASLCLYAFTAPVIHIATMSINSSPAPPRARSWIPILRLNVSQNPRRAKLRETPVCLVVRVLLCSSAARPHDITCTLWEKGDTVSEAMISPLSPNRARSLSLPRCRVALKSIPDLRRNVSKRSVTLGALSRQPRRQDRSPLTPRPDE